MISGSHIMKFASATAIAFATIMTFSATAQGDVVVGSKIDTEGNLLGNMIRIALEEGGIKTVDRISLGATPIVRQAILSGEIDIYPEYTGNAAFFFDKADSDIWRDQQEGYEEAKRLDGEENDIIWLTPSPANNTWAIAVRQELASEDDLETMSDFGAFVAGGGEVVLAASAEFVNSAAALPAFQKA